MSPHDPSRNVPFLEMLPVGGTQIGANELEREGTESGGSDGTSEGGQLAAGRSGGVAGAELSTGEASVGAVSRGRGQSFAAPQLRAAVESGAPEGVSPGGARSGAGALRGFRNEAGERAPGQRRWPEDRCRKFAAVDAGSGAVAPATETETVSPAPGTQAAFRRVSAARWQLPSLAGRAR